MPYTLQNSTFLDAFGANLYTDSQYQQVMNGNIAPLLEPLPVRQDAATLSAPTSTAHVTVGLVLDHATDPTSLLSGNWAQRQAGLAAFSTPEALWATYGANATLYSTTSSQVAGVVGGAALTQAADQGYTSSAADRTIWVTLDAGQFQALFGQDLQVINTLVSARPQSVIPTSYAAWTGNLQLNDAIAPGVIKGVWVDSHGRDQQPGGAGLDAGVAGARAARHRQRHRAGRGRHRRVAPVATPAALAAKYHFPLPAGVATGADRPGRDRRLGTPAALFAAYNLVSPAARPAGGDAIAVPDPLRHQQSRNPCSSELTLDISVVAARCPTAASCSIRFSTTHRSTPTSRPSSTAPTSRRC